MANLTIHNVKKVLVSGNTFDDFCTLKLDIMNAYESWDAVELYFKSTEDRKAFIETISEAGI